MPPSRRPRGRDSRRGTGTRCPAPRPAPVRAPQRSLPPGAGGAAPAALASCCRPGRAALEGAGRKSTAAARPAGASRARRGAGRAGGVPRAGPGGGREGVTLGLGPEPSAGRGVPCLRRGLRGCALGESPFAQGVAGIWLAVSVSRGCCASEESGFLSALSGGTVRRCLLALW